MPTFRLDIVQITKTYTHFDIEAESLDAAKTAWDAALEADVVEETFGEPILDDVKDDYEYEWADDPDTEPSDGDLLSDICREACDGYELDHAWVPFIADLVNGTNGAYGGPQGRFNDATASEYADTLAAGIAYRLNDDESDESIRKLDFTELYNTRR